MQHHGQRSTNNCIGLTIYFINYDGIAIEVEEEKTSAINRGL